MSDSTNIAKVSPLSFEYLAAARREWIENILRAWCRTASLRELRKAEVEWFDIAGRADTAATLWTWAWERFEDIVHPELPGVHETHEVNVTLSDGTKITGFPDSRKSQRGMLVLVGSGETGEMVTHGPFELDQIQSVART